MSPLPGTEVILRETVTPRSAPTETGVFFQVGLSERGLLEPISVSSLAEYVQKFGARQSYSVSFDVAETFFRLGGRKMVVSRVVGPAATTGTLTLNDRDGTPDPTLKVDAFGPGAFSANITVQVANGVAANTYVLTIRENGVVVETSPDLSNPAAAVSWALNSNYVRITDLVSATAPPNNNPAVLAATALSAGNDDRAAITDAQWTAALARYTKDLGPGQVAMPGRTAAQAYVDLASHAKANNRVALLDLADTATVATLQSAANTFRSSAADEKHAAFFTPWIRIPGLTSGTTRAVPPSAGIAGKIAFNDAILRNPNAPSAGENGDLDYAVDLTQPAFTEGPGGTRDQLNNSGINVIRKMFGAIRVYGWRSAVDPIAEPKWISFGSARTVMAIAARGDAIAERHVLKQLDGQGVEIAKYGGELISLCTEFYDLGALFGETPEEAFNVDVGPTVNTLVTQANGELRAIVAIKTSPFAERVFLEIVKVGLTEAVA